MAEHNDLGKRGEEIAIDYLLKSGFRIIERNYRFRKAEIDIIAQKDGLLIAVEVKTRSTAFFGDPYEFIKPAQQKLINSTIDNYVVSKNLDVYVRFDVISIVIENHKISLEHLEDAFFHF
jgi:putative endonuclease